MDNMFALAADFTQDLALVVYYNNFCGLPGFTMHSLCHCHSREHHRCNTRAPTLPSTVATAAPSITRPLKRSLCPFDSCPDCGPFNPPRVLRLAIRWCCCIRFASCGCCVCGENFAMAHHPESRDNRNSACGHFPQLPFRPKRPWVGSGFNQVR